MNDLNYLNGYRNRIGRLWRDESILERARGATGYDCGDEFDSPEQVQAYMQLETVGDLGDYCGPPDFIERTGLTQTDLDYMAEVIIRTRSHCAFWAALSGTGRGPGSGPLPDKDPRPSLLQQGG